VREGKGREKGEKEKGEKEKGEGREGRWWCQSVAAGTRCGKSGWLVVAAARRALEKEVLSRICVIVVVAFGGGLVLKVGRKISPRRRAINKGFRVACLRRHAA